MQSSGPLVGLLIGGLLTAGGWFAVFSIGKPLRDRAAASVAWPTADGRITRSEVERFKEQGKTMYTADVAYEYVLDGKTFVGDRVWFGDSARSSDQRPWRQAVERYPTGSAVKVHYDPADPGESVLEPGATWSGSLPYLIGLGVLGLGGLILLSAMLPLAVAVAALAGAAGRPYDPRDDFGDGAATPRKPPCGRTTSDKSDGIGADEGGADRIHGDRQDARGRRTTDDLSGDDDGITIG